MTATMSTRRAATAFHHSAAVAAAEGRMYSAELSLHAARQSGVTAWVEAAYGRLHQAIIDRASALAAE